MRRCGLAKNLLPNGTNMAKLDLQMQVTIHEAKTQLSKLIAAVERGEEVIIARRDKPVVRLNAVEEFPGKSRIGGLKGKKFKMTAKFDDPALNAKIAKSFNAP